MFPTGDFPIISSEESLLPRKSSMKNTCSAPVGTDFAPNGKQTATNPFTENVPNCLLYTLLEKKLNYQLITESPENLSWFSNIIGFIRQNSESIG